MSDQRLNRFLSVFSASVQTEILDFCRRISSERADIYFFLARKAAAFCDCLEELGQIHLDGYVTTDRSLDISGEWVKGKRVVLIDDAVVSGTTIYSTIQKLKQLGAESITVHVLTVNNQWFQSELLKESEEKDYLYPVYNRLPDSECIKLCNDIVQAISIVPRPYDVDFPLYKSISIKEQCLRSILALNGWHCYDIRTISQKENDIINFTMIPNSNELEEISRILGINVQNNNIVKVRIHGRYIGKKKERYSLRISPIVVLQEADINKIQRIFDHIVSFSPDSSAFTGWSESAKLRFLQFYFSNQMGKYWLYKVNHLIQSDFNYGYSYRNLSFLFPPHCISPIKDLCNITAKSPCDISNVRAYSSIEPGNSFNSIDPISLNVRLYEPFLQMYHDKELPCRQLVKQKGKAVFEPSAHTKLLNRLNEGLSFQELVGRLEYCRKTIDIEEYVSTFIDKAIDAGIIVPIVQVKKSTILRAYRHGEDVLFGHRENIMYRKMLSLFVANSGSDGSISKIEVEKLLVLFTKIGVKTKILQPYTSDFIDIPYSNTGEAQKILRIKPYLKGPVSLLGTPLQHQTTKNIPFITTERKSLWLTDMMLQNGFLRLGKDNKKYIVTSFDKISENDYNALTRQEKNFVEDFAELTGRISNPNCDTGVQFSDTDWTRISITLTLPDTITAIAAEMELFYREFNISTLYVLSGNKAQDQNSIKYYTASYAFESVQSAIMKLQSFIQKKGQALISSVSFPSNVEQRTWLEFFSDELSDQSEFSNSPLSSILYDQRVWANLMRAIVDSIFLFSQLRYNKYYNSRYSNSQRLSDARKRVRLSCSELESLKNTMPKGETCAEHFFSVYNDLHESFAVLSSGGELTNDDFLSQVMTAVETTETYAMSMQDLVCSILGEHGKINEVFIYNYAVHISIINCPTEKRHLVDEKIEQARQKEIKKITKDKEYAVSKGKPGPHFTIEALPQIFKPLPLDDQDQPGYWFIAHGATNDLPIQGIADRVSSFSMNIYNCLIKNGIDCRVSVFDRLPYEASVRGGESKYLGFHCNQFNIFIGRFKEQVLFPDSAEKRSALIHICPESHSPSHGAQKTISFSGVFVKFKTFSIPDVDGVNYSVSCYQHKTSPTKEQPGDPDFGIITVLNEELQAIDSIFRLTKLPYAYGERIFYHTSVKSELEKRVHNVICTQTIDPGESSATNAFHDLVSRYHPKVVFLIGIAGGIKKTKSSNENLRPELDYCDVVIAQSVIDYEMRKDTVTGIEHRGSIYKIDTRASIVVNDFIRKYSGKIKPSKGSKNPDLRILFEPIGSGNAVLTNNLSNIVTWLKQTNSKVAAVEMEAVGVVSALCEQLADKSVKGVIVIRGISDLADDEKDKVKQYRVPAAKNAAIVAKQLMSSFPVL